MPKKTAKPSISFFLNRDFLLQKTDETVFERGEDYYAQDRVTSLIEYQEIITANVTGNRLYQVKFWVKSNEVHSSCSCPMGREGIFCKHCVAVGLAWLHQDLDDPIEDKVTMEDLCKWLGAQNKEVLLEIIINQIINDERLFRQLSLKAAKSNLSRTNVATYKQAIDQAVHIDDFIGYSEAYDYADGIDEVVDSIEELLEEGHAKEVVGLAEYALDEVEEAINSVDDSSGQVGSILCRLQDIHHTACQAADINPEELATRLFEKELSSVFDTFYGAVDTYADILGETGLAMYRKLAEDEWEKTPQLTPESDTTGKYGSRFRITSIMEKLAKKTGDLETLIAIKERDLSSAWNYLQIAETYKEHGKRDLALEWAEKGILTFPDRTDCRLRAFLIDEYLWRKRYDEAMDIAWKEFTESPNLSLYCKLENYASQIKQWPLWREKALKFIREEIRQAQSQGRHRSFSWARKTDHTELVRIFLWEKDIEAAWKEASVGGCSDSLWMELAEKRKEKHPEDALPLYQRMVEPTIDRKNNDAYAQAVAYLKVIESLMNRLGRSAEFASYLHSVRVAHKPKRNLMKLLQREWP